jgi:hypothetical protein
LPASVRACLVVVSILAASFVQSDVRADPSWIAASPYPAGSFNAGSCLASDGAIYCVGGTNDDRVWYAPLDSATVGPWRHTTPYGVGGANHALSCAVDGGYIYCVGGANTQGAFDHAGSDVWLAPLTSSGVGAWQPTSNYSAAVRGHSCVTNDGFLYCIGGLTRSNDVDSPTDAVQYAPVSSSGVGPWRSTSSYGEAVWGHSCITSDRYVYCVGGSIGTSAWTSEVRYARIQNDGSLGSWTPTTPYGGGGVAHHSCAAVSEEIFCVGGAKSEVWSAPLSRFGVGTWRRHQDYPAGSWNPACVSDASALYCVGGAADLAGSTASAAVSVYPILIRDPDSLVPSLARSDAPEATAPDNPAGPALADDFTELQSRVGLVAPAIAVASATGHQLALLLVGGGHSTSHTTAATVALEPSSASYGIAVTISAVVTDTSDSPAPFDSDVTFNDNGAGGRFGDSDCQQARDALTCSAKYSAPNAGKQVTITVSHQDSWHASTLASAVLALTGSDPKITVTSSANPSLAGEPIHFVAGISPLDAGNGKVAFDVDGNALASPKPQVGNNSTATSAATSTLAVGIHVVTASYSGGVSLNEKVGLIAPGAGTMAQQVIGELKDEPSCQGIGGTWTRGTETCTVTKLTVDQANSFQIDPGITLANRNGTITIVEGGLIVNRGVISNTAIIDVESGATLMNRGVVRNECGEAGPDGPAVSGTVTGPAAVNTCSPQ